MKEDPLVSIVIATYNRADLLPRAIESILGQTYYKNEIIVVDDGSNDLTIEVLAKFDGKILIIESNHQGPAHARNIGMKAASGKYIGFVDSDDSCYPDKLSLQVSFLESHPDIGMVFTEISGAYDDGTIDEYHLKEYHPTYNKMGWGYNDIFQKTEDFYWRLKNKSIPAYTGNIFKFALMGTLVPSPTMMFHREILDGVGYQNEAYRFGEDYEFVTRICKNCMVGFLDTPTYKVYYHDGQMSRFLTKQIFDKKQSLLLKLEGWEVLLKTVIHHAYEDKRFYAENRQIVNRRIAELYREIASMWLEVGDSRKARVYLRETLKFDKKIIQFLKGWIISCLPENLREFIYKVKDELRKTIYSKNVN